MYFIEQVTYIVKNKNNKKEINKIIIGFGIAFVGIILLISTLIGSTSINDGVSISSTIKENIVNSFLITIVINFIGNGLYNMIIVLIFYIIFPTILMYVLYKNPKNVVIGIVGIMWQFFVFLFVYSDFSIQKTNTIFLVIIFVFWISLNEKEKSVNEIIDKVFKFIIIFTTTFLLLMSDINGLQYIKNEVIKKYSDSIEVAEFINNNVEDDAIFVCTNIPRTSAIIPYVKKGVFINILNMKEFTYVTWDQTAYKIINPNYIIEKIKKSDYNTKNIYLIESIFSAEDDEKIKELQNKNILSETLYESNKENVLIDEIYKVYKINL